MLGKHSHAVARQSGDMPLGPDTDITTGIQGDIVSGRQLQVLCAGKSHPLGC
ncbi:hypothetical protein D3C80_2063210 [compost metagenome]